MTQEQMKHDSDIEDVAIDSTSARPRSMPMPKPSDSSVVVVPQKRRRFSAQEKLELVRLTYLPGNTVSSVARQYGLQPSLLFRWRTLEKAGGLVAVQSGEQTVSASKYAEPWMKSSDCNVF